MGKSMLQVENYKKFLYYSLNCSALHVVMVNLRWGVVPVRDKLGSGDRRPCMSF